MTDGKVTDNGGDVHTSGSRELLLYAQSLAAVAAAHYGPPENWAPCDDLMGALSQIDNALTGLWRIPSPTPGEWVAERGAGFHAGSWVVTAPNMPPNSPLARLQDFDESTLADALIIAAAKDLLNALQFVVSAHGEQLHDAFDAAHKAIAKATGQ